MTINYDDGDDHDDENICVCVLNAYPWPCLKELETSPLTMSLEPLHGEPHAVRPSPPD